MKTLLLTAIATLGITAVSTAQNVPSYLPTDGLVGWWPFNGNANDESGNGNNGSPNNVFYTSDRFGSTLSSANFPNGNNNSEILIGNQINPTQFSISIWIRATGQRSNGFHSIISKIDQYSNPLPSPNNFEIQVSAPDPSYSVWCGFGGNNQFQPASPGLGFGQSSSTLNVWNHLVLTFNGAQGVTYLNGTQVSTNSIVNYFNPSSMLCFGNRYNAPIYEFNWWGDLDDIGMWSRVLTPQEITALYTATPSNNNETANTTANVPGAISYQAVARDSQGASLADTNVQVQFTLIADSLSGSEEYVETHTLTTNSLGLFTTAFGGGTPVSNTFANINWSAGNKFLNVQIDTGNGLVDMGTQQLLSTPYSLHSATAGAIKNPGLPIYSDNAAALAGGLSAGDMYRTGAGVLMVVY